MRIENPKLLEAWRVHDRCESCGLRVFCCAAHIFSRGAGQIDHPINLVRLGANPLDGCVCHTNNHNGGKYPNREDLLRIAAKRERTTPGAITEVIHLIRRLPKQPPMGLIEGEIKTLSKDGQRLAQMVFSEIA